MAQELKQLTPNLWAAQSQFASTNSGIIYKNGRACLIDLGILPAEIEKFTEFIDVRQAAVQGLILTHSHWDHLFGPEWYPKVEVIGHESFIDQVQGKAGSKILSQVEKLTTHFKIEREKPFEIPQPSKTFKEEMTLSLGGLELLLFHTPGHAADHLSIYIPEDGTLWAGDILSDEEIPYTNFSLKAYQNTLNKIAKLDIRCIVPGHGTPTLDVDEIKNRISNDIAYLKQLNKQVSKAIAEGLTVEETVESCVGFSHPTLENDQNAHKLNIESVYIEFGGEADPTKFGWKQFFE